MTIRTFMRALSASFRALRPYNSATTADVLAPQPTPQSTPPPSASTQPFNAQPEYDQWRSSHADLFAQRLARESSMLPAQEKPFHLPGYCVACESYQDFSVDSGTHDASKPQAHASINWRESLLCPCCGLNNRMRASIDLLGRHMTGIAAAHLYMTEQVTPLYRWMQSKYPDVIGSEYLGEGKLGGATYDGIRHEDTTRLSFNSASLDGVLSFDVLEHIPDYSRAIGEIFRCLRPGGFLLLSAPFVVGNHQTIIRARQLPDGSVEHLLPAEYHGNPTAPEAGSLCYYHFGWDLLDTLRQAGFSTTQVVSYYSFERGNFGKPQLFFWARKRDRSSV